MTTRDPKRIARASPGPRLTRPAAMKTKTYVYGVEPVNGFDAWALFEATAAGDARKAERLLAKDRRLANAQYWYQFPIHHAVRGGHAPVVRLLLENGADPGQSRFTYDSWDKLLRLAQDRGDRAVEAVIRRAMIKRFNYSPDFEVLKDALVARDDGRVREVLRRHPHLARVADALGNTALHWAVLTRQLVWVGRFVELGTPVDARRADGQTPVLLAVNGATDYWYRATRGRSHPSLRDPSVLVGSLLARGAAYTISVAAAVGDQERVEQLLRKDPGLAGRLDPTRVSPLSYAAREGHTHIVRLLLDYGADPNRPEEGAPRGLALYLACCGNHFETAELLLACGADPNAGVDSSECCLTIGTICHGDRAKPLRDLLRRHGAYTPPYRMTRRELNQAVRDRHEVVRHEEFFDSVLRARDVGLLDRYLEIDPAAAGCVVGGGSCPPSPGLVRTLLARGLEPNRPDWLGRTLLHACAGAGDRTVAAALLAARADINARDFEHHGTPLAAAVRAAGGTDEQVRRRRRMVEFLLRRGAATNLAGDRPWATPLAWATRLGHGDLAELLRQRGAT